MIGLGLLALACVLFLGLMLWIAKVINRKLVIWLAWTFGGLLLLLGWHPVPSLATKLLVNGWAFLVVLLPAWWVIEWVFFPLRPQTPPPDTGAPLEPIRDKDGRQIFP